MSSAGRSVQESHSSYCPAPALALKHPVVLLAAAARAVGAAAIHTVAAGAVGSHNAVVVRTNGVVVVQSYLVLLHMIGCYCRHHH